MTAPATVAALARGEVGVVERPAGSNRTKYGLWYGLDGNPWCAMFVSYVFWSAGLPLPAQTRRGFSYCPAGMAWFKGLGSFVRTGRGGFRVGDVAFYQFDHDSAPDHVGIVVETRSRSILCVEGNTSKGASGSQSNGGGVFLRERSLSLVLGVGRPLYSPSSPSPAPSPAQPPAWPGRVLTLTSPLTTGADVKRLQAKMASWGSKLTIDGVFGRATYDAVRWWQTAFALHVDGVVGRETWAAFMSK